MRYEIFSGELVSYSFIMRKLNRHNGKENNKNKYQLLKYFNFKKFLAINIKK